LRRRAEHPVSQQRRRTFTDVTEQSASVGTARVLSVGAAWFDYDNDGLLTW